MLSKLYFALTSYSNIITKIFFKVKSWQPKPNKTALGVTNQGLFHDKLNQAK